MPLLDEVLVYIKGLWLLIQGNLEGYHWLDISESGLWRSFTAILWTLPALAVGWASWRLYYLSALPTGTTVGIGILREASHRRSRKLAAADRADRRSSRARSASRSWLCR